jgi:hypothetical protein
MTLLVGQKIDIKVLNKKNCVCCHSMAFISKKYPASGFQVFEFMARQKGCCHSCVPIGE